MNSNPNARDLEEIRSTYSATDSWKVTGILVDAHRDGLTPPVAMDPESEWVVVR